eukprot:GHVL01023761.1.p1 GENE.GHVL01023761.1~~GHVL01023761.1.p1  ORF type:complete len:452 (-),score=133.98 GHVL01023761.1:76-1431(-)
MTSSIQSVNIYLHGSDDILIDRLYNFFKYFGCDEYSNTLLYGILFNEKRLLFNISKYKNKDKLVLLYIIWENEIDDINNINFEEYDKKIIILIQESINKLSKSISQEYAESINSYIIQFSIDDINSNKEAFNTILYISSHKNIYPFVIKINDLSIENKEENNNIIYTGLSLLNYCPNGSHAYTKIDINNQNISTINKLKIYKHIQIVNVSCNQIRNLNDLCDMNYLSHVYAKKNLITRIDFFKPPIQLEIVDISYNFIEDIGDWSSQIFLRKLKIRGNLIKNISNGLLMCEMLEELDLGENEITILKNLQNLPIKKLYLDNNKLINIEGIETLKNIKKLNISNNNILNVDPLISEYHPYLSILNISQNKLISISQLYNLSTFYYLKSLTVNPSEFYETNFSVEIISRFPRLSCLDGIDISPKQQVKAFDGDLIFRKKTWMTYLPYKEFEDR